MSPVETLLAEVLAAHETEQLWKAGGWAGDTACSCGWRMAMWTKKDFPPVHRAHVAAEQAKALREWLTSDEATGGVSEWWRRWPGPSDDGPLMHAAVLATLADLIGGAR